MSTNVDKNNIIHAMHAFDTPVVETTGFLRTGLAWILECIRPNPAASHFEQAIPDCRSVHDSFSVIFIFLFCPPRLSRKASSRIFNAAFTPCHAWFRNTRMVNLLLTLLSARLLSVLMKTIIAYPLSSCKSAHLTPLTRH